MTVIDHPKRTRDVRPPPPPPPTDNRGLDCIAAGCPNAWSVDAGNGRLCSAHAWAEPHRWPEITQQQQWAETDRARMLGEPLQPAEPLSKDEKLSILERLRAAVRSWQQRGTKDPLRWARRLKAREEAGHRLTIAQRDMWRQALEQPTPLEDA